WVSTGTQDANDSNGSNTTILKNGAINLSAGGFFPLNLAETNSDTGTSATTNFVWTAGASSTNWNNAGNWSCGGCGIFPNDVTHNVIIPQTSYQPVVNASVTVNDITVGNG